MLNRDNDRSRTLARLVPAALIPQAVELILTNFTETARIERIALIETPAERESRFWNF
jgi:hypothetical protein